MNSVTKIREAFDAISDDLNKTRAEFARQAEKTAMLLTALESFTTGISSQGAMPSPELQTAVYGTSQLDISESMVDLPKYLRNEQPPPPLPVEEFSPTQPEEQRWAWSDDREGTA